MTKLTVPYGESGAILYAIITRDSDGQYLIDSNATHQANAPGAWPTLAEDAVKKKVYAFGPVAITEQHSYSVYHQVGQAQDPNADDLIISGTIDSSNISTIDERISLIDVTGGIGSGSGGTAMDHNTGGADNLRYVTQAGVGIRDAEIKAYLKADWDAGRNGPAYVLARGKTAADGRWLAPMMLDQGRTYTLIFYKLNEYGITAVEVTI
jgi:hypothetical protein